MATWPKLTWSHSRVLIPIEDGKTRFELTERANRGGWSTDKLESVIRSEFRYKIPGSVEGRAKRLLEGRTSTSSDLRLLKPKLGILYTYRLIASPPASGRAGKPVQANVGRLKIDLGFRVHHAKFTLRGNLKAGQIVESRKQEVGTYSVVSSKREESDLYTYKAWVVRVVDGDTQFVEIDLWASRFLWNSTSDCARLIAPKSAQVKARKPGRLWKSV